MRKNLISFVISVHTAKTQYRKFKTNIPRKGIARSQSPCPHSCFYMSYLYFSRLSLPFLLQDRFREYINRSQTHECGNWDWGKYLSATKMALFFRKSRSLRWKRISQSRWDLENTEKNIFPHFLHHKSRLCSPLVAERFVNALRCGTARGRTAVGVHDIIPPGPQHAGSCKSDIIYPNHNDRMSFSHWNCII